MLKSGGAIILRGLYTKLGSRPTTTIIGVNKLLPKPVTFHREHFALLCVNNKRMFSTAKENDAAKEKEPAKDNNASKEATEEGEKVESIEMQWQNMTDEEREAYESTNPVVTGVPWWFRHMWSIIIVGGASWALGLAILDPGVREKVAGWISKVEDSLPESDRMLLPPKLPDPYGQRYTLIVDLDALVEYAPKPSGLVLTKRAGMDFFLAHLSKHYEVVMYSKDMFGSNQMVVYKVDPQGTFFAHHLFKESNMKNTDKFVTDLKRLNRDPNKTIMIDSTSPAKIYPHDNVICVGKGDPLRPDTTLIDLTPILVDISKSGVDDIRPFIKELATPDLPNKLRTLLGRPPVEAEPKKQTAAGGLFGFFKV